MPTPTSPTPRHELATYPTYAEAQRLVDLLSDKGFDVSTLQLVGRGLHTLEQVTGRLDSGRAAGLGAASGAWFGLVFGLLLGLFTPAGFWVPWLSTILTGAAAGALFGWVGHLMSRGERDFTSIKTVAADEYTVLVEAHAADEAARLMGL